VAEVAVTWGHDERTRINYLRDGFHMLREMATVRWNAMLGRYSGPIRPIERPTA